MSPMGLQGRERGCGLATAAITESCIVSRNWRCPGEGVTCGEQYTGRGLERSQDRQRAGGSDVGEPEIAPSPEACRSGDGR